jgi:peptidoglycan/LPS O-acetylase OafA/YrhL
MRATERSSIPSLDGFRAISILIVVASHSGWGDIIPGGLGVTIFFFLSGYLITTLLLREAEDTQSINVGHFYLRRILRLYPPLIVTLCIAYCLVISGFLGGAASVTGALAQLFYFANYYQLFFSPPDGVPAGTGVLWSLAVEEHFYLIYPLLFIAFLRMGKRSQLAVALGVFCAVALIWRMHLASAPSFDPSRTFYASDTRFDSILFGCIFALLSWDLKLDSGTISRPTQGLLACLGVAGLLLSLADRNPYFRETWRYSLQGICLMPIFLHAISQRKSYIAILLNCAPMRRLGVYSYSIYLIHFVILSMLVKVAAGKINSVLLLATAVIGSCGYGFLIDTFVDPYFRRIRRKLH